MNDLNTSNKSILITGASGHIGKGLVQRFLSKGFSVVGVANRTKIQAEDNFTLIQADLGVVGAGAKIMDEALSVSPRIDFIINNAARQDVALLESESAKMIHDIFTVNISAIAEIIAVATQKKYGVESILNVTSIEAITARPGHSIYGASKAALEALTKSAANELAPIRVNALRLGLIERDGIRQAWPEGVEAWEKSAPLIRMGTLKDVLRAVDFLLEAEWLTGSILTLDGGISSAPNW